MADNGWIKLHRKIRDNWIWEDPEKLRAWLDILLMVNHEDKDVPFNDKIVTVKKGQKLTSIVKLAERWGWSRHRVYRFLNTLKIHEMCTYNSTLDGTAFGTLITVTNWDFYQFVGTPNGTGNGTTVDTTNGTTGGTQTRMIKNYKEYKKGPESVLDKKGVQREIDLDALIIDQIINNGKTDINEAK